MYGPRIIYLLIYFLNVFLYSRAVLPGNVKPMCARVFFSGFSLRFYFKILGRGGENYKRLCSYLLPSRIQDHRS